MLFSGAACASIVSRCSLSRSRGPVLITIPPSSAAHVHSNASCSHGPSTMYNTRRGVPYNVSRGTLGSASRAHLSRAHLSRAHLSPRAAPPLQDKAVRCAADCPHRSTSYNTLTRCIQSSPSLESVDGRRSPVSGHRRDPLGFEHTLQRPAYLLAIISATCTRLANQPSYWPRPSGRTHANEPENFRQIDFSGSEDRCYYGN